MWKMPLRDKYCQTDHHHHGCCEPVHMLEPGDPPLLQQPLNTSKSGIQQIIECFRSGTKQLKHILLKDVDTIFECKLCRSLFRGLPNLITHKNFYCPPSFRMDDNSPHINDKQSQAVSDLLEAIYPRVDKQDYIIRLEPIETNQNAVFQYVSRADISVENTEMDDAPAQASVEMPEPTIEPPKAIPPPSASETVDTPPAANKAIVTSEDSTPSSKPELKCKINSDSGHQLICCLCKKEFNSRRNIRRHIRKVHKKKMEELKKFIKIKKRPNPTTRRGRNKNVLVTLGRSCPVCFKSFATKANVRRHFDEVHRGLRRDSITPDIATKPGQPLSLGKTSAKKSLKTRKQKSLSKAEYNLTTCKCLLCKRKYSSQVMLKKHMQIVHKVTLSTKNTKREKKTNDACNAELKVKMESTESAEPVPPSIVSPQNHVKVTNHSNERKNTVCTEKKNALFAERKSVLSAEKKGAPSPKKKSTPAIDKKTPLSERKSTPSSERKNASFSDRKNASTSERKNTPSSDRKNASFSERKNASSSERKSAPSAERKSAPSAERKKAPSAERKKASSTERKNAPSPERKSAPSADRKDAPSAVRKNASSERKSTPSAERKNASSAVKKSAPSVNRKNTSSSKRKSASSAERKNTSSAQKKSALSVQRKNASSAERKNTPSSQRKSAPSAKRKSVTATERKNASSAERKNASSSERKSTASAERKSTPPTKRNKVKQSSENAKPSNQTLAGCPKKPRKSRLSAGFDFRKLYCKLCKRQFTSKQNLTKHIELHTDGNNIYVKFYRCPLCTYETRRKRDVVRHITVVHKKPSCYLGKITASLERRAVKKPIDYILNKVAKRGPQRDEGKQNGSKQDITSNSPCKKYEGSDVGIEVKVTKNFPLHSCNKCGKAFAKKTLLEHHKKTHNASHSHEENNKTKGRHTRSKARV
ncbi:zinc finger protein 800 [Sceloporus undulatus]|uniref:zinc finger protein 800 n=1 Tax=Sceloporus undulatus TaxID=8520 RepID=UPI001C4D0FB7|nr:zinc finger protein 800 [Sceloporus undulatus]XP_042323986.1 zinc finger protein 800 [Sceloporus undulatus]XP_042323987.1 zinc finger protein 800 [Sceloporus undulatus]XP_042323988.1 zinc finger protein 800 [Sceloporus undulatus]XP_042323989.1 zinc finger protein 800 [Sceloporus undulatus]XP_042323990.1 zinc finger protein 800 [Sceloporus undulatus]